MNPANPAHGAVTVHEAELYRYSPDDDDRLSETPEDDHNHALGALRYLISRLDARHLARLRLDAPPADSPADPNSEAQSKKRPWLSIHNEALWDRLF